VDVTSAYAVFSVMGPGSRALLQELTPEPLDNAAFPFGWSRSLNLAGVTVRANRLTYVGELGWELYVPTEEALEAYQRLIDVGGRHGLRLGGYYAIESLRLEKGYRAWGRELTPETTPVEAGLLFACKLSSDVAFRGRPAVEKHRREGVQRRLVTFQVEDPEAFAWGNELLLRDGEPVGFATSAAFGHTVGSVVMMGYVERGDRGDVDAEWLRAGRYQAAIGGTLFDTRMSLRPLYDPTGARIKA
jgi:glycine cleavage system aminomethyltransferase T